MKKIDLFPTDLPTRKKVPLFIKIVFLILVGILVFVPLYQFVQGFEPEQKIIEIGH
ncbi:hypothetical protein [Aureivirga sp. CE67]|uniref:hypothetical protein n=1 Tax=Aureivirga sp. CE67 TaxID=1788983 RepID=UPI0018CB3F82|nr:hypothetical protein [Aureivirga sp. CE67]